MAIEAVKKYFSTLGLADKIHEFETSSATVDLAAAALGCAPQRIAKTLSFKVEDQAVLIVTAGDAKVDNTKFKNQFHTKAKMLTAQEVTQMVGHSVGGVCPFAIEDKCAVYLDISLQRFHTVFPACGSSNSVIELTIPQLEETSASQGWIDVCKNWHETEM